MRRRSILRTFAAALLFACVLADSSGQDLRRRDPRPIQCAALASLALPETTITLAEPLPAGANPAPVGALPTAICRVVGIVKPAVNFEVWLPMETWNGKFQGVSNDTAAGVIDYAALRSALAHGYATASTDIGHVGSGPFDAAWTLDRPDLVADFGHRGLHVATANAKLIIRAFYGRRPDYSYFVGCSKGGQQALMEAQRYPEDYDGIIAGSPANSWTRLHAGAHVWYSIATLRDPESYIPPAKAALLASAVTAACDAIDGIVDGVLDDPRSCKFDPGALSCKAGQDPESCYTPKQVRAIKDIWSGVRNSRGELVHPPLVPGGEGGPDGWAAWITGSEPFAGQHWLAADGFFSYPVFENPSRNALDFNFDTDLDSALAKIGPVLDSIDPDLRPFMRRGGKLLMYHGWSDPNISPLNTIAYFESVIATLERRNQTHEAAAREVDKFARLFMVPGMQHCSGGPGPNTFDVLTALENWVEKGQPPERIIASLAIGGVATRTRPLCPYPQVAIYSGSGSTDDAANFVCGTSRVSSPGSERLQDSRRSSAPAPTPQSGTAPPRSPAEDERATSARDSSAPGAPSQREQASGDAPPSAPAPRAPAPSAPTSEAPLPEPSAVLPNAPPVWQTQPTIELVEGVPAVISVRDFVRDADSDPLVIKLHSGELLPGFTWNPRDYTLAYDGRPLGAKPDAPFVTTGLVFSADDGKAASASAPAAAKSAVLTGSGAAPTNRPPVWESAPTIRFTAGVPAVVSIRDFVRDPDSDPLVITLQSGVLLPGVTWNPRDYTLAYDGRPLGADAPFVATELVFSADDGKP